MIYSESCSGPVGAKNGAEHRGISRKIINQKSKIRNLHPLDCNLIQSRINLLNSHTEIKNSGNDEQCDDDHGDPQQGVSGAIGFHATNLQRVWREVNFRR